jgi:hypothetical protein
MANADHFLRDVSSIAGNPVKRPFLLRTRGLKLFNSIRAIANTLLAYFI